MAKGANDMSRKKKAIKRFTKMGKLGKDLVRLTKKNGLDVQRLVVSPDGGIEVYLNGDGSDMVKVKGFQND